MPHDAGMARLRRIVAAGFPHHVTQRGNRRNLPGTTQFYDPTNNISVIIAYTDFCRGSKILRLMS
jgi:hypothetical protein